MNIINIVYISFAVEVQMIQHISKNPYCMYIVQANRIMSIWDSPIVREWNEKICLLYYIIVTFLKVIYYYNYKTRNYIYNECFETKGRKWMNLKKKKKRKTIIIHSIL